MAKIKIAILGGGMGALALRHHPLSSRLATWRQMRSGMDYGRVR
jgi:hypothetical protein